ncbi:unnamed protein product, partial [Didymodactylos carnosus]
MPTSPNREQSDMSARNIQFEKLLNNDQEVGETTIVQVVVENEKLARIEKRTRLAHKGRLLTKPWQTAAVIVTVLAIFVGFIGGLAYWITLPKVITQPYLLYGVTCYMNSRSCDATRNLYCPAGTCICTQNYQWNSATQNCSCGTYTQWTGFTCTSYGSYGYPCNIVSCLPTLKCQTLPTQTYTTAQLTCSCDNTTYLNTAGQCVTKLGYNF